MDTGRSSWGSAIVCVALSGACFYFGSGLHPIWWLMWIAPVPVLWVAPKVSWATSFSAAFLAFAIGGLNMWRYLHGLIRLPISTCLASAVVPALFFALIVLFFRARIRRGPSLVAVLAFPSIWVLYEYIFYLQSPHGTFNSLAYTQMNFLPVLQLASVTGVWGISFCLMFIAAGVAALLSHGVVKRDVAVTIVVVLGAVLGFGLLRLHVLRSPSPDTTVGLIASDLPDNLIAEKHDDAIRLMRSYAQLASQLASQGAQAVVIPEKLAVTPDSYIGEVDEIFDSTARDSHIWIVVGLVHPTTGAKWNEARVYSPSGAVAASYDKHHMLPPYESSFTIGTTRTLLSQPQNTWGVAICKDMDFPRLSREYARDHAGLLLVPAWDFNADGWLHGRMAVMRGVEDGFSIARAPKQGILTVTDDRGRVLAERNSADQPFTTLLARVPSEHQWTLYAQLGDWFAWVCIAFTVLAIGFGFRRQTFAGSNAPVRTKITAV